METILFAATVGSLLVAILMGAAAWRLSREERARTAARVAALAASASAPEPTAAARVSDAAPPPARPSAPVAPLATASAAYGGRIDEPEPATTAIEPRTAWLPTRVSTFAPVRPAAASAPRLPDLALNTLAAPELPLRPGAAPIADTFLGGEERRPSENRQRGLAVAATILLVVLGGGAYLTLSDATTTADGPSAAATSSAAPLELMSLRHERTGSRLALSGLVRNPDGGAAIEDLAAVVFLFDAQGAFVTSARTGVDFKRLAPGDESPFVISVDAPANVARYRVSFRTDSGVVAHVDRRAEQPAPTTAITRTKS